MKAYKLLTHREKSTVFRIVTPDEFRGMEKNERTQYFVADEGTLSYLATKVRKLNEHFVGLENETGVD
jgi:hypothetical protein